MKMRGLIRGHFLRAADLLADRIFRQEKMGRRSGVLDGCVCASPRSKAAEVSVGVAMQAARRSRDFVPLR